MTTTTPGRAAPPAPPLRRSWRAALGCLLAALLAPSPARADGAEAGRVVPVPPPDNNAAAVSRIRDVLRDDLDRFEAAERERDPGQERRVFKLILDFNPDNRPNSSRAFGACYDLADYLSGLQRRGVRTVAYVHRAVTGHSVLPVLACAEVVFSEEGELGDVAGEPGEAVDDEKARIYERFARNRYPVALVRKMFDRSLVVVKARPGDNGERYRDAREGAGERVLLAGNTARYDFKQAREFGLCQQEPRPTVLAVAEAYRLPPSALDPDPLLGRAPSVWLLGVDGPVTPALRERLNRQVKRAVGAGANVLIFRLRCHGGDSGAAYDLANDLAGLDDLRRDGRVKTIAYVTEDASDTATFLALACGHVVMDRKAKLGDFDRFIQDHPGKDKVVRENLEELARRKFYPSLALLARAMLDRDLVLYWAVPTRGSEAGRVMTREELDADAAGEGRWRGERRLREPADEGKKFLTLDARAAKDVGLAREVVDDLDGLYRAEGYDPASVHDATRDRDWLDDLADFLRDPRTSVVLVMVGITCLILELKMPGVGLPAIIAAVCFVLFFWSHSQLNGQITWLAALLFVLGLLLIGLEVFVLPGLGVAGISGVVLVLGSLGLVAYGHWPQSNEEWVGFGRTIGPFGISILGAIAGALILGRFLPSIPYVNRLILRPEAEAVEAGEEPPVSTHPELAGLLGAIGVAATPLRPAGKVQFGDDFVDVVAEGGYVAPGSRVQVVEIEGNRVVVKEV
jgi:membrane-bound ClpP family serine protease